MTTKINKKASQTNQPVVTIEKIYINDISLELPNAPAIFLEQGELKIDTKIRTESALFHDDLYQCSVIITVSAKLADQRTVFLVEVSQSGVFRMLNMEKEKSEAMLSITCPNMLFPYAREAVSNLISHAGFPPVLLSPINFEALYLQQRQQNGTSIPASE